jgi:hypothetical protein
MLGGHCPSPPENKKAALDHLPREEAASSCQCWPSNPCCWMCRREGVCVYVRAGRLI